jgi:methyl-accepting chemotaxis protein
MKLSTKMFLGTTVLAVAPILITSFLVGGGATRLARESLTQAVQGELTAVREVRKQQLTDYVTGLGASLQAFSASTTVVDGYKSMRQAYASPAELPKPDALKVMRDNLKSYYEKDFAAEYVKRNPTAPAGMEKWAAGLDDTQVALQQAFITGNRFPLGEKDKLIDATERTAYTAAHSRFHTSFSTFREKLGLYDIFLIDPANDRVVYTVFKEIDFTSSLADGISAKTGLGDVYRKVKAAGKAGNVALSDYTPYFVSYDDEASFMAVPIIEGDKLIGVLAAQLPLDKISAVMTAGRKWSEQGLGQTGETYLVGSDLLMRTDSRFLIENKAGFLAEFGGKFTPQQLAQADKKNTSIGLVKVETEAARNAIAGKSAFALINDYRGTPVFSAYAPVDIYGVRLALLAELDVSEALAGADEVSRQTLLRTALIALGVLSLAGLAGYFFVRSITRPVNDLSTVVRLVAAGDDQVRSTVKTGDELQELGDTFNKLLDDRIATLSKATKENEALNDSVVALLQTMFLLSQRDLTARAPVSSDIVGTVADSVNMLTDATSNALTDVRNVAHEVASSSDRANHNAQALAKQAARDRVAVGDMTRDIAQASSLMERVANLAQQSTQTAAEARLTTQTALTAVNTTVGEMAGIRESIGEMEKRVKRLGERSQEISQIVNVINSISERTHVLALNASMQAAMAGEAGRGFAVVTEEVQRLADASRNATMQIAQLSQNIQLETSETVAALNRTVTEVVEGSRVAESSGAQMRETEAATTRLAEAVQKIADESARQLELARRLAESALTIARSTDQSDRNVKSATDDAEALSQSSRRLVQVVSEFKLLDVAI